MRTTSLALLTAVLLGAVIAPPAAAAPLDLHEHWDQRCSSCHGHSADFSRRSLTVENGVLAGRHHRGDELARFLRNHYLTDELVGPVMRMLAGQVGQSPIFRERCARCHDTAAEFARRSLESRDGVLVGRSSGKPVSDTLATHGRLESAEVRPMVDTLTRVRGEVATAP